MTDIHDDPHSMEHVLHHAKERLLATGGHPVSIIACTPKGQGLIVLGDFPQDNEIRAKAGFLAGKTLAQNEQQAGKPYKAYFITEAWMSSGDAKLAKAVENGTAPRPSEDPNRKECLIITSLSLMKDAKPEIAALEMKRDASGKLIDAIGQFDKAITPAPGSVGENVLKGFFVGFYMGDQVDDRNLGLSVSAEKVF